MCVCWIGGGFMSECEDHMTAFWSWLLYGFWRWNFSVLSNQEFYFTCWAILLALQGFVCFVFVFWGWVSLFSPGCPNPHSVDQAGLFMRSSCLCLWNVGVKAVHHHSFGFFFNDWKRIGVLSLCGCIALCAGVGHLEVELHTGRREALEVVGGIWILSSWGTASALTC